MVLLLDLDDVFNVDRPIGQRALSKESIPPFEDAKTSNLPPDPSHKQSKESPPPSDGTEAVACLPCFPYGPVPWNPDEAVRLMTATDALVERSGTSGTDPAVRAAAALVASAYKLRDMETLQFARAEFEAAVRGRSVGPGGYRFC